MFIIIGIMFTGILTGYLLRKKRHFHIHRTMYLQLKKRRFHIHRAITLLIWLLLFLLGVDVGGNQTIIRGLHTIGLEALIITLSAVVGSTLAAWGLWYLLSIRNREAVTERRKTQTENGEKGA